MAEMTQTPQDDLSRRDFPQNAWGGQCALALAAGRRAFRSNFFCAPKIY